jgi:predicted dehydrogenase
MNRRELFFTAAAMAPAAAPPAAEYDRTKIRRVGLIGAGWYGKCDLFRLIQIAPVEVVSLCDVDSRMLAEAADLMAARQASKKRPRTYSDYRKMLAEKDLDIVLVGTPDHWHALPAIAAMQAGADVYVQKPISVDVVEGQAMLGAARKYKRVVQVGTQRRSTPHLIEARDRIVREGKLGKIALVEVYAYSRRGLQNPPDIAPPAWLDYEAWTGPAPMRPFNPLVHPRGWRSFMEYGNGQIGDLCIHMFDTARWMLNLGWPRRISSSGGILVQKEGKPNIPDTQIATWDFDDLRIEWKHRTWGEAPDPEFTWGATFWGDKGTLKTNLFRYDFTPIEKAASPVHGDVVYELEQYPEDKTEPLLEKHVAPAIRGHMRDFLAAIDARTRPVADIEQGHTSTACCILANVAMKLGRTLAWDAAAGRVVGDAEANRLLRRAYRQPWVHPEPGTV